MRWWQVVCVLVLVAYAYNLGRHRRAQLFQHNSPFLHDTEGMDQFKLDDDHDDNQMIWNLNGVWWKDAPIPPWWHQCKPQTCYIFIKGLSHHDRCACGGERWGVFGKWTLRDSRCETYGSGSS